jgi:hypothetical protein
MQKVSEYSKSVMAGHKLKERQVKPKIGTQDGKMLKSIKKPNKDLGQGMEQIKLGLDADLFNKLQDYCQEKKINRQEVIRLALRYHLNAQGNL